MRRFRVYCHWKKPQKSPFRKTVPILLKGLITSHLTIFCKLEVLHQKWAPPISLKIPGFWGHKHGVLVFNVQIQGRQVQDYIMGSTA